MTGKLWERVAKDWRHVAVVDWHKGDYYTLTVYYDRWEDEVNASDILINERRYHTEKQAVDAMNRAIRKINKDGYLY